MNITGEIPEALGSLMELMLLIMSLNKLNDDILMWACYLKKLVLLHLFDNKLTYELPHNVTVVNLVKIDLTSNN
uniref:Uncharacterized protein n=1 Tax=Leersia perrieri TaxID=77586 RepID=A0A0D9X5N5_9ORYZ